MSPDPREGQEYVLPLTITWNSTSNLESLAQLEVSSLTNDIHFQSESFKAVRSYIL